MSVWQPGIYLEFADERTRPAAELLQRIPQETPDLVIDLGCGPGNATGLLRARWPAARIVGVDNAPAMLKAARASGVDAEWQAADIAAWRPDAAPDVIFANAVLQWLPDHAGLLPRLLSMLAPGGVLALQMPRNFTAPSHTIVQQIVETGPWAERLMPLRDPNPVSRPEQYFAWLSSRAAGLDIWETEYVHVLWGEDAVYRWISATALAPYLNALKGEEKDAFVRQCKERLGAVYRPRENGATLFPFRRLFMVATRGDGR
mgnify:FL=1